MKKLLPLLILSALVCLASTKAGDAANPVHQQTSEYATIRWAGRDNTHIIRPGGQVEFVGVELNKLKKPDRADDRSFYMNVLMNALAKEGYEFAGISSDDIVMRRAAH